MANICASVKHFKNRSLMTRKNHPAGVPTLFKKYMITKKILFWKNFEAKAGNNVLHPLKYSKILNQNIH